MPKFLKPKYQILVCVPLCIYLLLHTGLFSDEFTLLLQMRNKSLLGALSFNTTFVTSPLSHYLFNFLLFFAKDGQLVVIEILKILYILLSIYLLSKFFSIFLPNPYGLIAAFFFIFYPIHDSITYFFLAQQMFLNFAFYYYAYYLAYNNRLILACLFSFLGSFVFYGSPPIALGLFVLFLLNKEIKKGLIIYIPNLVYIIYFLTVVKIFNISEASKLPKTFEISVFIKSFILQILTFIDAMLGPSMWMKIYYSFYQLSLMSWVVGCINTAFLFYLIGKRHYFNERPLRQTIPNDKNLKLIVSFAVMLITSFLMFAITGRYPQLAFNFGNRTTIFGSLLLAYLIVLLLLPLKIRTLIFVLFIFSNLGISDHWKRWSLHQQKVIETIKNNYSLVNYFDSKPVYVSGNQYSKYGPISHIEFLSEDWVSDSVFKLTLDKRISAKSLNKRHKYLDGFLIDIKYNKKTIVKDYINVYDSEKNILFQLKPGEINSYIDCLPSDNRHWVQLLDINFFKRIGYKLMPRLKYAIGP